MHENDQSTSQTLKDSSHLFPYISMSHSNGFSTMRRAIGAMKDQTSIGLAKVSGSSSASELDVAIVKATSHEEYPAEERHIREIISLTSYSRGYVSSCVNALARRLNKTRNWTVALKTLMLIQRLLSDGDAAYEQEIFFATRRGTRLLNMSDFRDTSRSNSWDFSSFVRLYALYLDERLEFKMQSRRGKRRAFGLDNNEEDQGKDKDNETVPTPTHDMKIDQVFSRIQHLQQLLERFIACRPTGMAKINRVVLVALHPIVKESFHTYYETTEVMGILIDRFMELPVSDCLKIYELFCRTGKQFDELDSFYGWCRDVGVARSSEYPEVEKITQKKLDVMEEFIRDKSTLAAAAADKKNATAATNNNQEEEQEEEEKEEDNTNNSNDQDNQQDINSIKALPPPGGFEEQQEKEQEEKLKNASAQQEADLLNLDADANEVQDQADKLALALFEDGVGSSAAAPAASTTPPWEAFRAQESSRDWETALVQSASHLSGQQPALGGGFDRLLLDGMYQSSNNNITTAISTPTGSASSVALGSAGRPGPSSMLALPAPPTASASVGDAAAGTDPFAASLAVAPPAYVQMSEMEKKQWLLVEEQLMWQQYARDGMQGELAINNMQQYPNPSYNYFYNLGR